MRVFSVGMIGLFFGLVIGYAAFTQISTEDETRDSKSEFAPGFVSPSIGYVTFHDANYTCTQASDGKDIIQAKCIDQNGADAARVDYTFDFVPDPSFVTGATFVWPDAPANNVEIPKFWREDNPPICSINSLSGAGQDREAVLVCYSSGLWAEKHSLTYSISFGEREPRLDVECDVPQMNIEEGENLIVTESTEVCTQYNWPQ